MTTSELTLPDDYPHLLAELKAKIQAAQRTAQRVVSTQLIELYWTIGKAILDRQSALEAPVDVDGRQMTLAGYLESMAAEPSSGAGHGDN